ncbi:MAG: DnaJ domain-containing protein [Beijerinckiaceae bacterium]|nr:DnaJ domain-containing protein [Beijerinckiaceae bacterium]
MRLVLLALGATLVVIVAWRWFLRAPPAVIAKHLRQVLLAFGAVALLFLAGTGHLNWLLALLGALLAVAIRLLPLLHFAPLLQRLWRQIRPQGGARGDARRSTVDARYVRMWLVHGSGEIDGEILAGPFAGKRLSALGLADLVNIYSHCRANDADSAALLQSYLDRVYGEEWKTTASSDAGRESQPGRASMTPEEAYAVLALAPGASRDQIIAAHRRLILRFHPDRGGSDYLAAKINQAKDLLLKEASA